jgi:NAD+ synthase (glutamine-hydrolysing)
VLQDVVNTEISPELVPGKANDSAPAQSTQSVIGPYELQDFNLYYTLRFGFTPAKVAFLALHAWRDRTVGPWPEEEHVPRNEYTIKDIKQNLAIFLRRFFQTSQFKRTCVPNAPKVGSGGSLSPRGDWRAPSDSESVLWLENLKTVPDA